MEINIIQDTREKDGLFKKAEKQTLRTGDYSFKTDLANYKNIFSIERKSPMDAFGTCAGGHARFKRELERAKYFEYFAIVIECSYSDFKGKKFKNAFRSKMKGYVASKIWNTYHMKYNIPVFYANDRAEARMRIKDLCRAFATKKEGRV